MKKPEFNDFNQKKINISLPLSTFKELFKESPKYKRPELPYLITSASYHAKLENEAILIEMNLEIESFFDGFQSLHLLPQEAILKDKNLPKNTFFGYIHNQYQLLLKSKGHFNITLAFYLPYISSPKSKHFIFHAPASGSFQFEQPVKQPEKKANITFHSESMIQTTEKEASGVTQISAFIPTGAVKISWQTQNKSPKKVEVKQDETKKEIKVDPIIYGDVNTEILINEKTIQCHSHIEYNIYKASVQSFELCIRHGKVVHLDGPSIKNYEIHENKETKEQNNKENKKESPETRITIHTTHFIDQHFMFHVIYEKKLDDASQKSIQIPELELKNTNRQTGKIALSSTTNIELSPNEHSELTPIDLSELPDRLKNDTALGSFFGFQYLKAPYHLKTDMTKHEELPVMVAMSDSLMATTVVLKEGKVLNQFNLKLRNNSLSFVQFHLPKDAVPLSALVNNKPVKPVKGDETSIMIPIDKSSSGEKYFELKLLFNYDVASIASTGHLALSLGQVDLPIKKLFWELYLPEQYHYKQFKGNVDMVDYFDLPVPAPIHTKESFKKRAKTSTSFSRGFQQKASLPIAIDIPKEGKVQRFEQYFVHEEEMQLNFKYKEAFQWRNKHKVQPL